MLARRLAESTAAASTAAHRGTQAQQDAITAAEAAAAAAASEARDLRLENAALQAAVTRLGDDFRSERSKRQPQKKPQSPSSLAAKFSRSNSSKSAPATPAAFAAGAGLSNGGTSSGGSAAGAGAWVLNRGKVWHGEAGSALDVATNLAMSLEGLVRSGAAQRQDHDFLDWTLETCELQRAQPPAQDSSEDADECVEFLTVVKRLLRVHAAAAAGKASERELAVEEESHFAYVIADVTYTIADIST
eukprot:7913-Heterococcus_DN1.PRE.1